MSKIRIVYHSDKTTSILQVASKSRRPDESEDVWLDRVFTKMMQPRYDENGEQTNPIAGLPYDDIDELPETENLDTLMGEKGKGIWIDEIKAEELKEDKEAKVKITKRIRDTAINSLKTEGEIPLDYED